jgi:hypothetical protein
VPKPPEERFGRRLTVSDQPVAFSLWPSRKGGRGYVLQPEVLSNSPWDVIEYRIKEKYPANSKIRKACLSFLEQAKNFYFASQTYTLSSKPLLLYYAFLNLAKAYILYRGVANDLDLAGHGVAEDKKNSRKFTQAKINLFPSTATRKNIVDLFGQALGAKPLTNQISLQVIKHIVPQIVIGHRLWSAASGKAFKFIRCERIDFRSGRRTKQIWLRLCIKRDDIRAANISHTRFAKLTKLSQLFHEVSPRDQSLAVRCIIYEQKKPTAYTRRPSDRLHDLVRLISPELWTIIRSTPPYRRYYLNLFSPVNKRLNPLIAIYLLSFYLGSVTRYRPYEFEKIQDSTYGMFIAEFLETEGLQFWYKLACEFGQQSVSLPAVVH